LHPAIVNAASALSRRHVVHLVGVVTDAVFSFLGPITAGQADLGVRQTVILVDDPAYRHLLTQFHRSVQLVLVPAELGEVRRATRLLGELLATVQAEPTVAVHLHGIIPSLIGLYATRFKGLKAALFFTPHGSRLLAPMSRLGALPSWLMQRLSGRVQKRVIVNSATDANVLGRPSQLSLELVESPVDEAFFEGPRREARRPLLVTGSHKINPHSARTFAQLAVLLGEEELQISCNWHGSADRDSLARLGAANVGVYAVSAAAERASRLASAWVYVAVGDSPGFPVFLAEAMAAGLPCVVWDRPYYRDLIEHDVTGLCCRSHEQLLSTIAMLIDTPAERSRLGQAAREAARERFDPHRFRESTSSVYLDTEPVE
jgi:glycosyltransferase involved in cell wall biosynthesis